MSRRRTPGSGLETAVGSGEQGSLGYAGASLGTTVADDANGGVTLSEKLAAYACRESIERIDRDAIERTKQIIAYHIGLACRALRAKEQDSEQAISIARELSEGCGRSTLIGHTDKVTLADAVFANCTMMRSLGLDDVIFPAGIHPGLMTLPVALGIAERTRASGSEMLTAIIVGYEFLGKLGQFSWAFSTPRRPTMPFGPFGSLMSAARMLRLTHSQTVVSLAYAAHMAMGLAESDRGPVTHYYSLVCRNAIVGAYAARAGAWGSPTVFEGQFGFIETFMGATEIDPDMLVESLGQRYAVMESCEKRYPGTALNQVAIELIRELITEHGIAATEVERLHFILPTDRENFAAGHGLGPFKSASMASSSLAFHAAMLLLDGEQRPSRYEDHGNPAILNLLGKMSVDFLPGKSIRYASVELRTKSGHVHVLEGDDFKFVPEPIDATLERDCDGILPASKVIRLAAMIGSLEEVEDVTEFMQCLVP